MDIDFVISMNRNKMLIVFGNSLFFLYLNYGNSIFPIFIFNIIFTENQIDVNIIYEVLS